MVLHVHKNITDTINLKDVANEFVRHSEQTRDLRQL